MSLVKQHIKLSPLSVTPSVEDLKGLFSEVQKVHNSVELPWAIDNIRFVLDVRINIRGQEPVWTLSQGNGLESSTVWSAPFNDVYLLREVVSLSVAEITLEHKQKRLTTPSSPAATLVESFNVTPEKVKYSTAKPSMPGDFSLPDGLQKGEFAIHSYRDEESGFTSYADIVSKKKNRAEQKAKTEELAKKPEQLIDKAEECINKAEESISKADKSINRADQSIDKAEKSIDKAEKSIDKAEQSINKAGQLIDGLNESAGLLAAAAKGTISRSLNGNQFGPAPSPVSNQDINPALLAQGISPPQAATYAYFYQHSVPIPLPVGEAPHLIQVAQSEANPNSSTIAPGSIDVKLVRKQTKFLMGQFLVDSGLLPENTLKVALKLQAMVGGNVISRAQAIDTINRVHYRGGNLDIVQLMRNSNPNGQRAISEEQSYPLLGGLLVKAKVIDDSTLEAVLKMEELVRSGAMSKDEACQLLNKELVRSGLSKKIEKTEVTREQKTLDLLIKAGLISKEDKKTAFDVQKHHGGKIDQILIAAGKLSAESYEAAFKCEHLIYQGKIKLEEAIIALNYCERSRINLTEAVEELGFQFPL